MLPDCPKCHESYTYEQGALLVCPMCGHEWVAESVADEETLETEQASAGMLDAVGNPLEDGDTVTIVRDLRVSGAGGKSIKAGTKVKGILLLEEPVDGHDIDATVPGFGRMRLKSSVVRKA